MLITKKRILWSIAILFIVIFILVVLSQALLWILIGVETRKQAEERTNFEESICNVSFIIKNVKCSKIDDNFADVTFTVVNSGAAIEDVDVSYHTQNIFSFLDKINKTNIESGESKLVGPFRIDRSGLMPEDKESIYVVSAIKYNNEFGLEVCSRYPVEERLDCV